MTAWFCDLIFQLILCLATAVSLMAQDSTSRIPSESKAPDTRSISPALESQMLGNERAVWDSAKTRDMQRFAELVADDARMIFASGVITKQEYMQAVAKRTITEYSIEKFQAFLPNGETVITLYEATVAGTSNGKAFPPSRLRESSVWVLRAGKWVAVWNQETPIP